MRSFRDWLSFIRNVVTSKKKGGQMDKWLIVENGIRHKKAFAAARVPFAELEINSPRTVSGGLAFPEDEKDRALEILGLSGASLIETPTDKEGVFLMEERTSARASAAVGAVKVVTWNGQNKTGFVRAVREILVPVVGDVVLTVPHGENAAPMSNGKFHIHIWSSPSGKQSSMPPKMIWGIEVNCRDSGFTTSGQGTAIIDPSTGWAVGELVGDNLYIHHDLCHEGTDWEIEIFRRLLKETVVEMKGSPEERIGRRRKLVEAQLKESLARYVKECEKRIASSIASARTDIRKHENTIEKCQLDITKSVRLLADSRKKLEQLENSSDEVEKRFAAEFERLRQMPGVANVTVADGIISVFTENIAIPFDGMVYDIGKFRIDILTSGEDGGVRCFNLTRNIGDFCHPHVRDNGYCCLGNIASGVAKLIGEYEYAVLAQIMIQYLQNVNPDSWYASIDNWPKVKKPTG